MEKNNKKNVHSSGNGTSNVRQSYEHKFLKSHSMKGRGEKSIYIRQEYHERLTRIALIIGENKIPLYAYLDNILTHHFGLFEQEIIKDYNRKNNLIF